MKNIYKELEQVRIEQLQKSPFYVNHILCEIDILTYGLSKVEHSYDNEKRLPNYKISSGSLMEIDAIIDNYDFIILSNGMLVEQTLFSFYEKENLYLKQVYSETEISILNKIENMANNVFHIDNDKLNNVIYNDICSYINNQYNWSSKFREKYAVNQQFVNIFSDNENVIYNEIITNKNNNNIFVKPISDIKYFESGIVQSGHSILEHLRNTAKSGLFKQFIENDNFKIDYPNEFYQILVNENILNIKREFRCLVSNKQLIHVCQYKANGVLDKQLIDKDIQFDLYQEIQFIVDEFVKEMPLNKRYLMDNHYPLIFDFVELDNGEIKLLETNGIHCSGLYNIPVYSVIECYANNFIEFNRIAIILNELQKERKAADLINNKNYECDFLDKLYSLIANHLDLIKNEGQILSFIINCMAEYSFERKNRKILMNLISQFNVVYSNEIMYLKLLKVNGIDLFLKTFKNQYETLKTNNNEKLDLFFYNLNHVFSTNSLQNIIGGSQTKQDKLIKDYQQKYIEFKKSLLQ